MVCQSKLKLEFLNKVFGVKLAEELNQDVLIEEKNQFRDCLKIQKFYLISKGGPVGLLNLKKKIFKYYLGLLDEEAPLINIEHRNFFKNS